MQRLGIWAGCLFVMASCSDETGASVPDAGAADDASLSGDALSVSSCNPKVTPFPLLPAIHLALADFTPAAYNSNPPSSGPHCGVWGQYTTFVAPPLPRCNWIHNLEHGAVVLLHNCPEGCSEVSSAFANIVKTFKGDALCTPPRFVITPDPNLGTKVAAAAWGWTFTADCLDVSALQTLSRFVADHYGRGPEDVCSSGQIGP